MKGHTNNPSGRPAGTREAAERMAEFARKMLYRKVSDAADALTYEDAFWQWALTNEDADVRLKANFRLQDYAYGKPTENVHQSGSVSINVNVVPVEMGDQMRRIKDDSTELTN